LSKFFYSPTDAQVNCLKNNFKIYIKIDIKTAPTCFGAVTPSTGSALLVLAKVTAVKIANYGTSVCGDVGAVLVCNFNVNFKIVFKKIHLCISW
jgi:hypothetical protein